MSKIIDGLTIRDSESGMATEYKVQDTVLKARVDNLVANAGDTNDNAELLDIRVGEDGKTYPTAGDAVRGQATTLKEKLSDASGINNYSIKPIKTNFFDLTITTNQFILKDVTLNTYVNSEGIEVPVDNYNMTGFIKVFGHNLLLFGGEGYQLLSTRNIGALCWYDESKVFIERQSNTYGEGHVIPELAYYVRIQFHNGNITMSDGKYHQFNQINLDLWSNYEENYEPFGTIKKEYLPQKLWDINHLVTFGDSHVSRGLWQQAVIDYFRIPSHLNLGVGSSTVAINSTSSQLPFVDNTRIQEIKDSNCDAIIIIGGTNDVHLETPLGTNEELLKISENKNKSNFYGAYSYLIETLLTWKPTLKLIISTIPQGFYDISHPVKYVQISNAIKEIAFHYSLPIVDIFGSCGINKVNLNTYSSDKIHYNQIGNNRVSKIVIETIKKSYIDYQIEM